MSLIEGKMKWRTRGCLLQAHSPRKSWNSQVLLERAEKAKNRSKRTSAASPGRLYSLAVFGHGAMPSKSLYLQPCRVAGHQGHSRLLPVLSLPWLATPVCLPAGPGLNPAFPAAGGTGVGCEARNKDKNSLCSAHPSADDPAWWHSDGTVTLPGHCWSDTLGLLAALMDQAP